jgi:hypothetical protein
MRERSQVRSPSWSGIVGDDLVWQTIIGTLGGVAVTAVFGLVTAYFTHRWQRQRSRDESHLALDREIRTIQRETYAKYIVSAQNIYQTSIAHFVANRERPRDPADVGFDPPADLRAAIVANEALRVEVVLLAGPSVRFAVDTYGESLNKLWPSAASGTELHLDPAPRHITASSR